MVVGLYFDTTIIQIMAMATVASVLQGKLKKVIVNPKFG
jgi:hypothetical protein